MNINIWIEDWVNLFPEEAEFNGYKIKSKSKDCLKKMLKFVKDNPIYTKDIIFAATKQYIEEKRLVNWEYMKQSTYFISKIGQPSLLEQYCEKIINNVKPKEIYNFDYNIIDDFI